MENLTHTVISNNVVNFKSAARVPVKSLKCHFKPRQKGAGDPSPENIREINGWNNINCYIRDENLFENETIVNGYKNDNGVIAESQTSYYTSTILDIDINNLDAYQIVYEETGNLVFRIYFFDNEGQWISRSQQIVYTISNPPFSTILYNNTIQFPQNCKKIQFQFNAVTNFSKVKLLKAKIIPITFPVLGKNILNMNMEEGSDPLTLNQMSIGFFYNFMKGVWLNGRNDYMSNIIIQNNSFSYTTGQANAYGIDYCLNLIPGTKYSMSGTTNTGNFTIQFFDKNKKYISMVSKQSLSGSTFTTPENTYYALIMFLPSSNNSSVSFSDIQLELGDTVTAYEPYDSNNTVYGGYIDIAKGELVQQYHKLTISDGSQFSYRNYNTYSRFQIKMSDLGITASIGNVYVLFNYLKLDTDAEWCGFIDVSQGSSNARLRIYMPAQYNSVELFSQFIREHPLEVSFTANEQIYKFSPIQLKTLLNQNNIWSDTNDIVEVSYAIHDTASIRAAKHRIAAAEPHIITGGSTFTTDLRAPLKSAKIYFNPVQEGTGDPSPTNIRPVTGWTGLSLYHSSNNLYIPNENNKGYINSSGVINVDNYSTYTDLIPVTVGNTYSFKCTTESVNGNTHRRIHGYNSEGTWVQQLGGGLTEPNTVKDFVATVTIPSGIGYIRGSFRKQDLNVRIAKEDVYTINWENEAGTIYGGYIDLITGQLVRTYARQNLGAVNWQQSKDYTFLTMYLLIDGINEGNDKMPNCVCDKMAVKIFNDFKSNYLSQTSNDYWISFTNNGSNDLTIISSPNFSGMTPEQIKSRMSEFYLYMKLPLENYTYYSLSPQNLKTLRGINNIWSDSNGSIEIKYWTH